MSTNGTENRRGARVPVTVEVSLESESNFFAGIANNVSEGGVFVATETPPPVGTQVTFDLALEGRRFPVAGVVRWVREQFIASDQPAGCGVQWSKIAPEALQIIQRFVEFRPAEFFED